MIYFTSNPIFFKDYRRPTRHEHLHRPQRHLEPENVDNELGWLADDAIQVSASYDVFCRLPDGGDQQ